MDQPVDRDWQKGIAGVKLMFGKKGAPEPANYQKIDTLIGKETNIQGTLVAKGTIRIDGEFKGDVQVQGDLVVGDSGRVEATVEARSVLIAGYLKGNIQASGLVDLAPTARLYGDIRVANLIIEEGAVFKGNCLMEGKEEGPSGMQDDRDRYQQRKYTE